MAVYNSVWTIFGILLIHAYALPKPAKRGCYRPYDPEQISWAASGTEKSEAVASPDQAVERESQIDHNLKKRFIDGMAGSDDMGYLGYPESYGFFQDSYGGYPEKRHASRWALIHRKLAELENSKRYNYPMESSYDDDKRSASRWRFIHDRLKQLNNN